MAKPSFIVKKACELQEDDRIILGGQIKTVIRYERDFPASQSWGGPTGRLVIKGSNNNRLLWENQTFIVVGNTEKSESSLIYRLISHKNCIYVSWGNIQFVRPCGYVIAVSEGLSDRIMGDVFQGGIRAGAFFQFNEYSRDTYIMYTNPEYLDRSIEFFKSRYNRVTDNRIENVFHAR